jgi:protein pelota
LNQLTGIAAILTFPLDIEVVEAEEKAAKETEEEVAMDAKVVANGVIQTN